MAAVTEKNGEFTYIPDGKTFKGRLRGHSKRTEFTAISPGIFCHPTEGSTQVFTSRDNSFQITDWIGRSTTIWAISEKLEEDAYSPRMDLPPEAAELVREAREQSVDIFVAEPAVAPA